MESAGVDGPALPNQCGVWVSNSATSPACSNAPFVDLVRDPGLPPALLPPDWPRQTLEATMTQLADRYLPAASRYAHHMIETY